MQTPTWLADLTKFATKDTARPSILNVLMTDDRIEATNGHYLIRAESLEPNPWPKGNFNAQTLSTAIEAAGKGSTVVPTKDGIDVVGTATISVAADQEREFPDTDQIVGALSKPTASFGIDPAYLMEALGFFKKHAKKDGVQQCIQFDVRDPLSPITLSGVVDGAKVTILIMPMRL